jgi:hypothetical protein
VLKSNVAVMLIPNVAQQSLLRGGPARHLDKLAAGDESQVGTRAFQPTSGIVAATAPFEDHTCVHHGRALLLARPGIQGALSRHADITQASDRFDISTECIAA